MLGENIKNFRKQKRLSQRDLAKELNVANGTISQWENKLRTPSLIDIKRIANYFNIEVAELIGEEKKAEKININNFENISLEQKKLIEKIKKLTDAQCIRLNAYTDRLLEELEENKTTSNFYNSKDF